MVVLVAAAALLLLATGAAKLHRPAPTATALLTLMPVRLARHARALAVLLGLVEIVVGLAALLAPGPVGPALLALVYVGFAGYVARALRSGDGASCGCSGRDDTPVTPVHLALNLAFAVVGVAAAASATAPLVDHGAASLAGLAMALLGAYAGWLAVTVLPQLAGARAALRAHTPVRVPSAHPAARTR